jgi:hypothetical protein
LAGDRCAGDAGAYGDYIERMEKIISREGGKQLRHTYEKMTPEKRPQDVRYKDKLGGPVLSRRDGVGLKFLAVEQHGLDTCPEIILVSDHFRGRAAYQVQERHSTTSQRPQTDDIVGRDLRYETLEHGPDDDMPQAIRVIDPQGRSAIYRSIMEDGKVVDSKGFKFEPAGSEAS